MYAVTIDLIIEWHGWQKISLSMTILILSIPKKVDYHCLIERTDYAVRMRM